MPKKVPIGIDDFSELVNPEDDYLYVDKTPMIKEFLDKGDKCSLIIRPRRWGKTLNMSMLQCFFSSKINGVSTKGMFNNLKIAKEKDGGYINKYQGKYPVIFITFKEVKENNYEEFLSKMYSLIQKICNDFPELETSTKLTDIDKNNLEKLKGLNNNNKANSIEIRDSLNTISTLLFKHYSQKVIILIDEYDTPLNYVYNKAHFEQVVNFFKGMFGSALKGNYALEKGVITGILRLSKNKMLSDINNLKLYSMLDNGYSEHFGFTEEDVSRLCGEVELNNEKDAVKSWYNGYRIGNLSSIYNPWSIVNYLSDKKLEPYWVKTGDENLLKELLLNSSEQTKQQINTLLNGHCIESFIDQYISFEQIQQEGDEVLWSLLWTFGYLNIIGNPQRIGTKLKCSLKIPNYEIECSYNDVFLTFMRSLNKSRSHSLFLENLSQGNIEQFLKELKEYLLTIPSYFDFPKESNYHTFMLGLTACLKDTHYIESNLESGIGRFDMLLVPRNVINPLGIILEFKKENKGKKPLTYSNIALKGLTQIDKKKYDTRLKDKSHIKQILKLSIVFYGKEFTCKYKIEEINALQEKGSVGLKKKKLTEDFIQKQTAKRIKLRETSDPKESRRLKFGATFIPGFSSMTTRSNNENIDGKYVSKIYWYEDNDILTILKSRVIQNSNRTRDGLPVYILGPLDNVSSYSLKEALASHNRQLSKVLIPFNLGQLHWVGLVFEYDGSQNLIKADYYDPQGNNPPDFLNLVLQSMEKVGDTTNKFKSIQDSDGLIHQTNGNDCGPCTIENLLSAIGYREAPYTNHVKRRLNHLNLLESMNFNYYKSFYERQRLNQSSFIKTKSIRSFDPSVHFSISEYKALLSLVLDILQLPEKLQSDLKDSFRMENIENDQEHTEVINKIRLVLKPHTQDTMGFHVIEQIFYVKDKTDVLENIPLKLDYNQIQTLRIMLELPKNIIESDIKEINQSYTKNILQPQI